MMILRAGGAEYPVTAAQKDTDRSWDGRASRAVTLTMPYAQAAAPFVDGLSWAIIYRSTDTDETGTISDNEEQYDNSDFCVAGAIIDNRDGTITAKMGKRTDADVLAELEAAYDGN